MSLRVVIVDDEPLAREGVRMFLSEEPDVEIVAECADGAAAVNRIEALRPDVLFLDVQMPRLNGFEVLAALDAPAPPVVIFTTAHDEHAIRAQVAGFAKRTAASGHDQIDRGTSTMPRMQTALHLPIPAFVLLPGVDFRLSMPPRGGGGKRWRHACFCSAITGGSTAAGSG